MSDHDQHYEPDHSGMYELEFPGPQLTSADGRGPVLVHALEGFSDAGHAVKLAAAHLRDSLDTELVASFAIDDLLDYRSRRPTMTFKTDRFTGYEDPQLGLYALHDTVGTPFLLLAGMEPDLKWERFVTAVRLLAERLRAGGAGIPGFYTATGVGTVIAEGKEHHEFNGKTYILERGIVADLSIVKAWKADPSGNLVFRKTARNFNPPAATAGKVCVVEVEEIVPLGSLDPDTIHLPGIYVHRIIQGDHEKRIENRTTRKKEA